MRACLIVVAAALVVAAPAAAKVNTEPVGTFNRPTDVTAPPQDPSRLFVVEQQGVVRVVVAGVAQPLPFLDLSGIVLSSSEPTEERGMYSMAFAPDYATSGRFYVFYIALDGKGEIAEYRRSATDPNVADPASGRLVLEIPFRPKLSHYGGQLAFDAGGNLYISVGDGSDEAVVNGDPQSLRNLFGKILRIRPFRTRAGDPYTVPATNPFVGRAGALPEIWAYGLRNPFRFSLDRATGDMVIGDVGQHDYEEVEFGPRSRGTGRARNFGWSSCEGDSAYPVSSPRAPCDVPGHTDPVHIAPHTHGACSITGGFVVRDPSLEELQGRYLYGDFCKTDLRKLRLGLPRATGDGPVGTPTVELSALQSLGEDACGRVYMAERGGPVKRLVGGPTSCALPLGLPPAPLVRPTGAR